MESESGHTNEPREHRPASDAERAAFLHREILQLAVLMLAAVTAFFVTRAVAASNRQLSLRDAAEWYRRGELALAKRDVAAAIDAFRRATVRDRHNRDYVLALARALARRHDDEAARSVLLATRESAPEDAEINLELARLAAHRQDVTEATRFYRNALYAPWPAESADARRRVRIEFIRFLLTHDQSARALSELLAAVADLPEQPAVHLEAAQLFSEAGDDARALQQFQRALQLDPGDRTALAGAGQAAFRLGQYELARSILHRAPADVDNVAATRAVVDLVLADDPLAKQIGSSERRRRLAVDLEYARERLGQCDGTPGGGVAARREALLGEAEDLAGGLKRSTTLDQDALESGVDLVDRIAAYIADTCGPASPRDRALALIARRHGVAAP